MSISNDLLEEIASGLEIDGEYSFYPEVTAALRELIASRSDAEWRPIETAATGQTILVSNPMVGVYASNSEWCAGHWLMLAWGNQTGRWFPVPTHWRPLPQPPTPSDLHKG